MNLNYVNSLAERFMKFRTGFSATEDISENLFNAVSIYVPKSLAADQFASGAYDPETVTATSYAVIAVTADNYTSVFSSTSEILSQWEAIFNDGANVDVTLYCIVFDDTDFALTLGASAVAWAPLTKAFKELYFISFFKTLFSTDYSGASDTNYFDLALALSKLCEDESTLSMYLNEVHVTVPEEGAEDTNACQILSLSRGDETGHCTTFTGSDATDRAKYFWGYVNLMGGNHTMIMVHNGSKMIPIVLAKWMEDTNSTGEYVGNKLAKIRLSGSAVKPTGLPSPLNSDVNLNLISDWYENLDDKYVGYFISISGSTANNAELLRERNVQNFPVSAYMIGKWIDYNTSQDVANFASANTTLSTPVLANEEAYNNIQALLIANIQKFAALGRLEDIVLDFPAFSEAKKGQSFSGTGVWTATYIDDLESVTMTGEITF